MLFIDSGNDFLTLIVSLLYFAYIALIIVVTVEVFQSEESFGIKILLAIAAIFIPLGVVFLLKRRRDRELQYQTIP
ncbi:6329_t:CDS:2 [Entrophospora sp. SA101]|nr:6329_t:CDS:2 [Entrophospora sp. SA101]